MIASKTAFHIVAKPLSAFLLIWKRSKIREFMHYLIDGYNILFRLLHGSDDLQSQRQAFIYDLNKKISLINLDVSIVFDSTFQIGGRSRTHYDALEILYSAEGETADE